MTIQDLFVTSNQALLRVIDQIKADQWELDLPKGMSRKPATLKQAVRYHTYDDAWVPDVLAGKTKTEVGDIYEELLANDYIVNQYRKYNQTAIEAVKAFTDLERLTYLSYGDFPARDYLQHIISFRAFRSYDIAKLIGIDTTMDDNFVEALTNEFSPVVESYRQMGVFQPEIEVPSSASPQAKLIAMVGRQ